MGFTNQAIAILIILLPGFFMLTIYQELSIRKQLTDGLRVIYSLGFSAVFYWVQDVYGYSIVIASKDEPLRLDVFFNPPIKSSVIGALVIILVPALFAVLRNYDVIHKVLRKVKITNGTSKDSTWLDALEAIDTRTQRVRVIMDDGKSYIGYVSMHSDDPNEKTICLSKVYYEKDLDSHEYLTNVKSVMFVNLKGVKLIEIHEPDNHRKEVKIWLRIKLTLNKLLNKVKIYRGM